jgi:hypothetical protein
MADAKKKEEPAGPDLLWSTIAVLFVLFAVTTFVGRINVQPDSTGTVGGVDAVVPTGDAQLGKSVINRSLATLRQSPGGPIIGEQLKRAAGKIAEGPVTAFGREWIRVDYNDDPDGWVLLDDVTTNVGWFRALNIFPIFFDLFRPIGIGLTIIFSILLGLVIMKQKEVAAFEQKKKRTEQNIIAAQKPKEPLITVASGPLNIPGVPNNLPTGLPAGLVFERGEAADVSGPKNERWERVERLMTSTSSSDWRQAVIEADIILDEMLTRMGYEGSSIGDRLKQIEQSDFVTLNKAWEAHKVRNHLAHRGGDYVFPKNEADRVIGMYRQVFSEFYYI